RLRPAGGGAARAPARQAPPAARRRRAPAPAGGRLGDAEAGILGGTGMTARRQRASLGRYHPSSARFISLPIRDKNPRLSSATTSTSSGLSAPASSTGGQWPSPAVART